MTFLVDRKWSHNNALFPSHILTFNLQIFPRPTSLLNAKVPVASLLNQLWVYIDDWEEWRRL